MLQNGRMLLLPGEDRKPALNQCTTSHRQQSSQGVYLASRTLGKNRNSVSWNPSVCTQQPRTSVWMTLLTNTQLTDLDGEMNRRQYNSKRPGDHKQDGDQVGGPTSGFLNTDYCYFCQTWGNVSLTVPLLRGDVTPVLAHSEDVLHQETAVVVAIGGTAVGALQDLRHVFQQLAAL